MPNEFTEKTLSNGDSWSIWAKYVLKSLEDLKLQHSLSENKIDSNKDDYIKVVNNLELVVTRELGDLRSELKLIQNRINQRAAVLGVIAGSIPAIIGLIYTLIKIGQTI